MSGPLAFDSEVDFDIASSFAVSFDDFLGVGSQLDPLNAEADTTSAVNIFEETAFNHDGSSRFDNRVPERKLERGTEQRVNDRTEMKEGDERKKDVKAPSLKGRKARKKRFRLNHSQTRFLMNEFARQAHPDAAHRARLSKEIPGLSPRQVQVWFQNRRAKLKRLALEDRERMLRSHELQDFEAAAAAAEAAAAALYGSDATFQDPAALAACVPSQQPLPVNSFHQFTSMPYGLHTDDIIQSPLFLQTCHGAGPAPALALAAGPSAGPGTSLGNDVAGSVGPPQPLYSFNVDSVADWEASYAPQQLLSMHEDELMMQGVRASETEIRGGDERSMSACDHQLSLQDRALSEELPVPWVDTNPVDCHHQHQQQQHPQSMLNLHQPSMMARPADSDDFYQPQMPSYYSSAIQRCNWFVGADQLNSPPLAEQSTETTDEMNFWKYQANQFASIDMDLTPSFTCVGGILSDQGEVPMSTFPHHDHHNYHVNDDSS